MKNKYIKKCYQCGKVKKIKYFPLSQKTHDGHNPFCISCIRTNVTGYYTDEELSQYKSRKYKKMEVA